MTEKKILLVDDDVQACQVLTTYLMRKGYQAVSVHSGEQALARVAQERFDLVLIDLSLPDYHGVDLLQEMKARDPEAIYMIVSGYASFENALLALKKGADDFISKPVQLADMNLRLEKAMETKALQRRVQRSDSFYHTILNSMRDAIAIINIDDYTITGVNQAFLDKYGYTEAQTVGRPCYEVTHRAKSKCCPPAHCCPIDQGFEHAEQVAVEHVHCNTQGKDIDVEVTVAPIRDETGRVVQVVHATRDISARKQTERQIQEQRDELARNKEQIETNRAKLQAALDQLSSLIKRVAAEKDLGVQFIHPELPRCWEMLSCEQTQCPCHSQEPMRCWQMAGTYCGKTIQGVFAKKISNCMQCRVYQTATNDPIYQIGEQFNNMMHILQLKNQELEKAYAELKATQSQMLQQEKMASIGQLAAGVAHEINNPMGFISSNLNTLGKYRERFTEFISAQNEVLESLAAADRLKDARRKLKIDYISEDSLDLIKESLDGAERVKEIVQNLKSFSRIDQAELIPADLNECLETTLKIIWNELKYKSTVSKHYGELPRTRCYPQQLNQVFMNLLVNAGQAIAEKGEITIRTWHDNGVICVAITDTGSGIPADKLTKIFEPFYTTKPVGKGTGLGLSIVYDIVNKHHGEILVDSELGRGTTFTVKIPVVDQAGG